MRSAFVTVGTTCFDELIAAVSAAPCLQVLRGLGYGRLVLQIGRGTWAPRPVRAPDFTLEPRGRGQLLGDAGRGQAAGGGDQRNPDGQSSAGTGQAALPRRAPRLLHLQHAGRDAAVGGFVPDRIAWQATSSLWAAFCLPLL
uniref:UDP-N-acetylglucosamine transferase subunit ALG13 n=1 Tax=Crocodylus porosus TaxID=8502 RepID=A0A7M4G3H2_CROPO